jgi:hypothetical protein
VNEIERLQRDLGEIPKELRRRLRPALREAGEDLAGQARSNASWSSKIPSATKVRVSFAKRRPGVSVGVDKKLAPNARPFEHGGEPGSFRHPVYPVPGRRVAWVSQVARPFLAPAAEAKEDQAVGKIADAVDRTTREAGFR